MDDTVDRRAELLTFYQRFDRNKTADDVAALLRDHSVPGVAAALLAKFGAVPDGWERYTEQEGRAPTGAQSSWFFLLAALVTVVAYLATFTLGKVQLVAIPGSIAAQPSTPAIAHVYIVHWTKLTQRRADMEQRLDNAGLLSRSTFIDAYDAEVLPAPGSTAHDKLYDPFRWLKEYTDRKYVHPTLTPAELSTALKHAEALKQAAAAAASAGVGVRGGFLVLEDDAILRPGFETTLARLLGQLAYAKREWDVLELGAGFSRAAWDASGEVGLEKGFKRPDPAEFATLSEDATLSDTSAYLVSATAAQRLARAYEPVAFAADCTINFLCNTLMLSVWRTRPALAVQGTVINTYSTTMSHEHVDPLVAGVEHAVQALVGMLVEAVRRHPSLPQAPSLLADAAEFQLQLGKHAEGVATFERAAALRPAEAAAPITSMGAVDPNQLIQAAETLKKARELRGADVLLQLAARRLCAMDCRGNGARSRLYWRSLSALMTPLPQARLSSWRRNVNEACHPQYGVLHPSWAGV